MILTANGISVEIVGLLLAVFGLYSAWQASFGKEYRFVTGKGTECPSSRPCPTPAC